MAISKKQTATKKATASGKKANTKAQVKEEVKAKEEKIDQEASESEESDSSSEEESDEEENDNDVEMKEASDDNDDTSSSEEESSSSSEEEEEEEETNSKKRKAENDDEEESNNKKIKTESDDENESSDDDDEEKEEEEEEEKPPRKPLNVEYKDTAAPTKAKFTVFVGQLNYDATEDDVRNHFSKCGAIEAIRLSSYKNEGKNRGTCFIDFEDKKGHDAAIKLNATEFMDRKIKVDHDEPRERKEQISEESNILFFANLDFSVTEGQLEDLFSQHGNVELITLLTKAGPENVSRGCGYAEFTEKEDAIKAFGALRNATIEGRPLRLDFAGPRGSDKVDNKKNHAGFKNKRGGFNNRGRGGFNSRGGSNNRGGFKSRGGFNKRGGFKPRA